MLGGIQGEDGIAGAAGGDRTHDPWLRRPILYPLSYSRTEKQQAALSPMASVGHGMPGRDHLALEGLAIIVG